MTTPQQMNDQRLTHSIIHDRFQRCDRQRLGVKWFAYFLSHLSSHAMIVSCQRMLFFGFSTQWFSSGK